MDEAQERVSSPQFAEFQAAYEHSPFGQHALHQQLAIIAIKLLRSLGDDETELEDILFSPYEFKQKTRTVEDLDDEELEEMEAQQAEDLDSLESDMSRRRKSESEEQRLSRKAVSEEL